MNNLNELLNEYYSYSAKLIYSIDRISDTDAPNVNLKIAEYLDTVISHYNNLSIAKAELNLPMFDFSNTEISEKVKFENGKLVGDISSAKTIAEKATISIKDPFSDADKCYKYELAICILHTYHQVQKMNKKSSTQVEKVAKITKKPEIEVNIILPEDKKETSKCNNSFLWGFV